MEESEDSMKKNQKRKGYEIILAVVDGGQWPEIAVKDLMQHVTIDLPAGLAVSKVASTQPELKVETVSADWKDVEGLIDGFRDALKKLGVVMISHPDFEGSDTYGFILSNRRLTKAELKDECIDEERC